MSYPTRLDLFKAWAKAMEQGATVDKPNYRGTTSRTHKSKTLAHKRRRKRRRRRARKAFTGE